MSRGGKIKESSKNLCINCWSVMTCPLWQMCYSTSIIADQSVRSLHDGFWINHWSSRTYVRCKSHTFAVSALLFCGESVNPRRPSVCNTRQRDDELCLSSATRLVICGTNQKNPRYFSCSELDNKLNKYNVQSLNICHSRHRPRLSLSQTGLDFIVCLRIESLNTKRFCDLYHLQTAFHVFSIYWNFRDWTWLFYIRTQSVPRSKHSPPRLHKIFLPMLCKEKVALY